MKKIFLLFPILLVLILTSCEGQQLCLDSQYLSEEGLCKDISCFFNSDCDDKNSSTKDICENPGSPLASCIHERVACSNCEFISEEGVCKKYICCTDSHCDDKNENTSDICKEASTLNAHCENRLLSKEGNSNESESTEYPHPQSSEGRFECLTLDCALWVLGNCDSNKQGELYITSFDEVLEPGINILKYLTIKLEEPKDGRCVLEMEESLNNNVKPQIEYATTPSIKFDQRVKYIEGKGKCRFTPKQVRENIGKWLDHGYKIGEIESTPGCSDFSRPNGTEYLYSDEFALLKEDCLLLPSMLESCQPFSCSYFHIFTNRSHTRTINGKDAAGNCLWEEDIPGPFLSECTFSPDHLSPLARFYEEGFTADTLELSSESIWVELQNSEACSLTPL